MPEEIPDTPPFPQEESSKILDSANTYAIQAIENQIAASFGQSNPIDTHARKVSAEAGKEKDIKLKLRIMEKYKYGLLADNGVIDENAALKAIDYTSSIEAKHVDLMINNLRIYAPDIFELPGIKGANREKRQAIQRAEKDRNLVARLFIWRMVEMGMSKYTEQDIERVAVSAITNPNHDVAEFAWHEGQNTQTLIAQNIKNQEKLVA